MESDDVLMSVPEAGRHLGKGRVQTWRMVDQGKLPAQRVGRTWAVKFSDVQAMEDRRKSGQKSEP